MGNWGWAIALAAVLICTPGVSPRAQGGGFTPEELAPLVASLEAKGLAPEMLRRILYDPRLQRMDRAVAFNVLNPDNAAIYKQFVEPFAIRAAQRYRRGNLARLERVEAAYGVPKDIIVGILLVETQFGKAHLPYRPLEVFLSLILDATPAGVERHFERMKRDLPDIQRAFLEERLTKKATWAYTELVALLSMSEQRRVKDLYAVRGSFAGAIGMPQFLPSSYLAWAVDGNGDRRVDLNDPSDAMASIANFLRVHGWQPGGNRARNQGAVWAYNRSAHYVNAIFGISNRLAGLNRPRRIPDGPKPVEPFDLSPVTAEPTSATILLEAVTLESLQMSP